MKQCPECKREMKDQLYFCPFDGQTLLAVNKVDKLIGVTLDDKYRLEEKIGEGGMGKVYRATHVHMGHTIAIKILHPHLSSDYMALERFRREARAAACISHPNAVAVSDFGVTKEGGIAYLVMELLEGVELRDKIKQERRLDFEESFIIVQQICQALHVAHSKGIIHRDLKPDNIWLIKSESGIDRVKVLDFGIAKLKAPNTENLTQQGMIVGTPYYMSPEQCMGDELDARSDIYSLGIILYEMLTGQVPFQASTPMGVALKQTHEPPKPPSLLRAGLPEPIENVVLRTLRKKREDRPATAIEMAQEFEAALYKAGIELKLLGTRTPQTSFTLNTQSDRPFRTPATPQPDVRDVSMGQTGGVAAAPVPAGSPSGSQQAMASTPAGVASTPAGLDIARRSGNQSQATPDPTFLTPPPQSRKMLYITIAATLIVLAAVAVVLLTRPKQAAVTSGESGTAGGNTNESGTKPPPPPPTGMVLVRGGNFKMGNPNGDDFETPVRDETVASFYMDQYEVTNKHYYKFVVAKKYKWPEGWPAAWKSGNFKPGEGEQPVTNVTWIDADTYAKWAQKRLPTQVEWEYAARGSDGRLYPWGNDFVAGNANVNGKGPVPVNAYPRDKSPFDVFGMAGNVSEWTDSVLEGGYKVIRGASFAPPSEMELKTPAEYARATRRQGTEYSSLKFVGFRCAKSIQ